MRVTAFALAITLSASGCTSFLLSDGPGPHQSMFGMVNENPDRKPICTDDFTLVYIDAAFALAWLPLALLSKPSDGFGAHEAAITGGLILGGLSATSAGFGIHDVVTCRRATREWQAAHPGESY